MKKKETGKKNLKWILLIACVLITAVAVAVFVSFGGSEEAPQTQPTTQATTAPTEATQPQTAADNRIYWNVDKVTYSTGTLIRNRRSEDDLYYVRFAVDGEQVDLPVADELLVSFIDTLEVMGLVFDEDGIIVDVRRIDEFAGRIIAEDFYVQSFTEEEVICNALGNGAALSKRLKLNADTKIYGVDPDGSLLCGLPGKLQELSKILAISDDQGNITHIFTEDPFKVGDIYWNVSRQYDSATKLSKRSMDAMGRFEYLFALNGEQVTMYTKDQKVANAIDKIAAKCMGLVLDENGYITEVISTKKTTGNGSFGSWYHVMDIQGDIVTATKYSSSDKGTTVRGTLSKDVKVYDVSGTGAYVGEPTELRLYDQVHGLKNPYGEIIILFVISRTYQADIYWNVERQWDSAAKQTKRTPAADGYYYIKLATAGEQVTLRTQNKDLVNSIDAIGVKCFGLETEGDVITQVYASNNVWGGRQFCSWDVVTSIENGIVTAKEADAKKTPQDYVGPMAEDCNIYNVSSTAGTVGERTTLQVGDKIHALKDLNGKITHIFVVGRQTRARIYWNLERSYSSATKQTTRTPNAEGYYEFKLAYDGEVQIFKTKSKALATKLDAAATRCFGLYTNGDVITRFFATTNVVGGEQFCSWDEVTAVEGKKVVAKERDTEKTPKDYIGYVTAYTKIINVSGAAEVPGEKTTVQVGDIIHALKDGECLTYVFVVERQLPVVEKTGYCDHCAQDVTWYSWDGARAFESGKHYYLNRQTAVTETAYIGSAEDSACEVVLDLCGFDITASARLFRIYGSFWLYDSGETKGTIHANYTGQAPGFYVYDNGTMHMYGGNFVDDGKENTMCGMVALGLNAGSKAVFNMYGGSLVGGTTAMDGGNVQFYRSAVMNLYGGTVSGGVTGENGGNINVTSGATLNIYGGTVTGGTAATGNCIYAGGTVNLHSQSPIKVDNIYLAGAPVNIVGTLAATSSIGVTLPSGNGPVSGTTVEENLPFFTATEGTLLYLGDKLMVRGQADKVALCSHCGTQADWYIWDGSYAISEGHYYLSENVQVSAVNRVEGQLCLDLNGCNIAGIKSMTDRIFRVYGTLNLMDSVGTGVITAARTSGQASIFYVYDKAVFNMYGGTIRGTAKVTSTNGGGLGGVDKGTMNLYGGVIEKGNSAGRGGNIALFSSGTLNVYGGQILDGTSDRNGGNISMDSKSYLNFYGGTVTGGQIYGAGSVTLYPNDTVTLSELYLPAGQKITLRDTLAANTSVTLVLAETTGVFATDTVEANKAFFHGQQEITFMKGSLAVGPQEDPDAIKGLCEHCKTQVEWTVWNGQDTLSTGHYCLTEDLEVSATAYIGSTSDSETTVCLDLRGNDITAKQRLFRIYGTLNLMDSAETDGTVYGKATGQATGFYVYDNGTFNMYGGTFVGGTAANTQCGIGALGLNAGSKAVFNMYGGCLRDGNTKKDGANLALYQSSVFNMYGGQIIGGKTLTSGGSISMGAAATLNLYGGSIGMGQAEGNGNCINGLGTVNLYGNAVLTVAQIRLPEGKTLTVNGKLAEGSSVGILLESTTGAFGTSLQDNSGFFTDVNGGIVTFDQGVLSVESKPAEPVGHTHCLCAGTGKIGDHTACTQITWTPWPGVENLTFDGSVGYYLTEKVTLDATLDIPSGGTLNLCLNSNGLEGADRVFAINGTLNLTDCAKTQGEVTSTKVRQAPVFYVRDGGVFNLYGGTLKGTKEVTSNGGLGVIGLNAGGGAVMNMYGGTVTGGNTTKVGGNIYLYHDSVLNIYGGEISGGTATGNGGNLGLGGTSKVIFRGGEIKNGVAASGGNFLLDATGCSVEMYGGTVTGTTISGAGANVRVSSGTFKLYNGLITGGTTTNGNGGSIFITGANAAMEMYGGTVTGGTANSGSTARHGGNIYVASSASLKIVDDPSISGVPTVSNGTATSNNGGNIYYGGKVLVLDGALITGGSAPGNGDNVYINTAGAVLKGKLTVCDTEKENIYVKSGISVDTDGLAADADADMILG